jgi:multiple sugar transport system substrate-binding protein
LEPYRYFATRYALLYSGTLADLSIQQNAMAHNGSSDRWIVIPYPGQKVRPPVLTGGPSYAIMVNSPERQLASWLLIRWLMQPKNQARLITGDGGWPASTLALQELSIYQKGHSQWGSTLDWIPIAQSLPRASSWLKVHGILTDALWQIFQTNIKADQIPSILNQLDQTVAEVLARKK